MTTPELFQWSGVRSGVKSSGDPDLALCRCENPATVAGVFTGNTFAAAPVREASKRLLEHSTFRGLVVNSGVANAATGQRGMEDNRRMIGKAAECLGVDETEVLSASTGHIGEYLDLERIGGSLPEAGDALGPDVDDFSTAITTTDTSRKITHRELPELDATVTGIAKGAGMIRPHMATMLAFVFVDRPVEGAWWQRRLEDAVRNSFNRITVDGEMSTNDTVLAFAADRSGIDPVGPDHEGADRLTGALNDVTGELARMIVRDGEGATRLLEVSVTGAPSDLIANDVADSIAGSNLLKAALHGGDPNWGRIFSAVGATERDVNPETTTITMDGFTVYDGSGELRETPEELEERMATEEEHTVTVDLGQGSASTRRLTCDLTEEYVRINSDYEP